MYQRAAPRPSIPDTVADAWSRCIRHWRPLVATAVLGALVIGIVAVRLDNAVAKYGDINGLNDEQRTAFQQDVSPYVFLIGITAMISHVLLTQVAINIVRRGAQRPYDALRIRWRAVLGAVCAVLMVSLILSFILSLGLLIPIIGLFLVPLVVFLGVNWSMTVQSACDGMANPFRAIRQSTALVSGSWWRVLGLCAAFFLLALLPSIVFGIIDSFIGSDLSFGVTTALSYICMAPFMAMGFTLIYAELAERKGLSVRAAPPWERTDV